MPSLHHLLFTNWRQKLISLILGILIWAFVKESIDPGTFDQILSGTVVKPEDVTPLPAAGPAAAPAPHVPAATP
ncbi:MAG: hypothetical protein PW734_03965 [Verrucomicrobium sp.]|nr:hypothetical protein [Verrucomicrobium sp.]